jgi:sensor histidine kinase YesM
MSRRPKGRAYWWRILLANAVGALAVVGVAGAFGPGVSWSILGRDLGISFVYANCIGTLLAVAMPMLGRRCGPGGLAGRWPILLPALVVGTIAGTFVATTILFAVGYIPAARFWDWLVSSISQALVISLIIGVAVSTYEMMRSRLEETTVALRTKERDEADARRLAAEAQHASLEARVQPHFLFNTLNSIAALVHEDPAGAERMTTELASLMRASLDSGATPLIPLEDELRIVRAYLDIEHVRFGDRLRYDIAVGSGAAGVLVPRLSLQTLVENSVKYAVTPSSAGASIRVRAEEAGGRLALTVEDNGPGFDGSTLPEGHGLALLRARLDMLFGGRASVAVDGTPGRTRVSLAIPSDAHAADPDLAQRS